MNQPTYLPGHDQAIAAVEQMTREQLFDQVDVLYGRDKLSASPTDEELRKEAIRQVHMDWLDPLAENFQMMKRILNY